MSNCKVVVSVRLVLSRNYARAHSLQEDIKEWSCPESMTFEDCKQAILRAKHFQASWGNHVLLTSDDEEEVTMK